ncbi:phosphatidylglycerol lysyltransferase domain-containing protein [Corynebacterium epidermidicanis]|uniref:Phosphatidylglycerol lysyltransferase C-terminal domain-containing protein n=1 Tax=Corynebacterium epidermidicanis TaxID=1050174 RepID=A0A0G3GLE6_9CORY|nr:phosphatidylglycerol lysyltransferase domain-containing protein [Corynebacterium epidermidicanis]AKK02056.1 hypothetical protein CEPID_00810 [Corynebacterium epidermidicanis]
MSESGKSAGKAGNTTPVDPGSAGHLRAWSDQIGTGLRWAPVTFALLAVVWGLRIAFGFNTVALRTTLGFSLSPEVAWWTVFTSMLSVGTWAGSIFTTLVLLTLGVTTERVLGSRMFVLVLITLHSVSVLLGAATAQGLTLVDAYWGHELTGERILAPGVGVFGAAAFATHGMNRLWQRRIRFFTVGLAITLLLYAGIMLDFALLYSVVLGIVAGIAWGRRQGRQLELPKARPSIREIRILVATVVGSVFVGPVLTAMNPDSPGPFADVSIFVAPQLSAEHVAALCELDATGHRCQHAMQALRQSGIGPLIANFLPLLVIAVILYGLARGRRLAWRVAILAHLVTIAVLIQEMARLQLIDGDILTSILLAGWLTLPWLLSLALLGWRRPYFQVVLDRSVSYKFRSLLTVWAIFSCMTWLLGAWFLRGSYRAGMGGPASWQDILASLPVRFVPPAIGRFYTFDVVPVSNTAWWLTEWVGIMFWFGFLVMFYRALAVDPNPCSAAEREQAHDILVAGSGDHISWMTLWSGNSYWFHPDGYVAYRLHNSIAVTVGEPVVRTGANPHVLADAFEVEMYARGAQVAWYSVRAAFAADRAAAGWRSVPVAQESVLHAAETVEFKGKKFQDVRTARNRADKEGIRAVWTTWDEAGVAVRDQIVALSEEWVAEKSLPEMGFTLGGLPELADPAVKLMVALDESDRVHGVTSWLPAYSEGKVTGLVLDFMRRDTEGFRPVVEFLIAETLLCAHEEGLAWISLSGAPLAVAGTGVLGGVLERVGGALEPLYGFRSLAAFKRKFQPSHEEWLLAYRDELALPAIGMAVSKCYLPRMDAGQVVHVVRSLRAS